LRSIFNKITLRSYSYFPKFIIFIIWIKWFHWLCQKPHTFVRNGQRILGVNQRIKEKIGWIKIASRGTPKVAKSVSCLYFQCWQQRGLKILWKNVLQYKIISLMLYGVHYIGFNILCFQIYRICRTTLSFKLFFLRKVLHVSEFFSSDRVPFSASDNNSFQKYTNQSQSFPHFVAKKKTLLHVTILLVWIHKKDDVPIKLNIVLTLMRPSYPLSPIFVLEGKKMK
jgi:hypothetical protein